MELSTYKSKHQEYTYYLDEGGKKIIHGENKIYHDNGLLWQRHGRPWQRNFSYHGESHGECKRWERNGELYEHYFCINGKRHPFVEMNEQEKLLFQIKHPGFKFLDDV